MPDPKPLSEALAQLIALRGFARRQGDADLQAAWQGVAGEFAGQTRAVKVVRGVLQVDVGSAAVLSQLVSFHQAELTHQLQQRAPHFRIQSLKFRLAGR